MAHRNILRFRFVIVESQMALGERSAAAVLAAQTNGRALKDQRPERERFPVCPVQSAVLGNSLTPLFVELAEFRMNGERVRESGHAGHNLFGQRERNRCGHRRGRGFHGRKRFGGSSSVEGRRVPALGALANLVGFHRR